MASAKDSPYKGSGALTREQLLFYETRTAAKMMTEGLNEEEIVRRVTEENLFQYPTERMIQRAAQTCVRRLRGLNDMDLVSAVADESSDTAKQICLYAMMKQYRLLWDFMITVIGEKYRQQDFTFARRDLNGFFLRLQEQDDVVASWSELTVKKLTAVISRVLIETEYIENSRSNVLNPVLIGRRLENAIRANGDDAALPAFNCLT